MGRMIDAWHDRYHNDGSRDYGCPHCQDEIMSDTRKYGTTNPVLIEARVNHDPYDQFAWVQEWRFAIAQRLEDLGEYVPSFRGADDIRETYGYEAIAYGSVPELRYALKILDRFREWLKVTGRDY